MKDRTKLIGETIAVVVGWVLAFLIIGGMWIWWLGIHHSIIADAHNPVLAFFGFTAATVMFCWYGLPIRETRIVIQQWSEYKDKKSE